MYRFIVKIKFYNALGHVETWSIAVDTETPELARDRGYTDVARLVGKENILSIEVIA